MNLGKDIHVATGFTPPPCVEHHGIYTSFLHTWEPLMYLWCAPSLSTVTRRIQPPELESLDMASAMASSTNASACSRVKPSLSRHNQSRNGDRGASKARPYATVRLGAWHTATSYAVPAQADIMPSTNCIANS